MELLSWLVSFTEQFGSRGKPSICIRQVNGCNLTRNADYTVWAYSRTSSVAHVKCRYYLRVHHGRFSISVTIYYRINIHNIQRYIFWITDNVVQWSINNKQRHLVSVAHANFLLLLLSLYINFSMVLDIQYYSTKLFSRIFVSALIGGIIWSVGRGCWKSDPNGMVWH